MTIVGARPQFIKAAVVSRAIGSRPGMEEVVVHTGQHYDHSLSGVFFHELDVRPPDYHLDVGSGSHGVQTGRMLERVEAVLTAEGPDWVMVYGDTNSTVAGALAAAKLQIPIAHVEAGLRSFNRRMPEELNRVVTDHLADLLLAPTAAAVVNLQREGIGPGVVHEVGDVMFDVALCYGAKAEQVSDALERLGLTPGNFVLATVHRAENTDALGRLSAIVDGLALVAQVVPVVLPLHPRTRHVLDSTPEVKKRLGRVQVVDPLSYLDMMVLQRSAAVVATDSGGVQKEAFFHRTPCITLRAETEWTELVELGWNRLCFPRDREQVRDAVLGAIGSIGADGAPYGDGQASERIAELLERGPNRFRTQDAQ